MRWGWGDVKRGEAVAPEGQLASLIKLEVEGTRPTVEHALFPTAFMIYAVFLFIPLSPISVLL
jgi:hypothetical protein